MRSIVKPQNRAVLTIVGCILAFFVWVVFLIVVSGSLFLENDESFTVRAIRAPPLEMLKAVGADGTPPLHYIVLKAWSCFAGNDIAWLRLLSIVSAAASLPLVFRLANRCTVGSSAPGWIAVVLSASAANIIVQAITARFYAMALFLILLSHITLLDFVASGKRPACWGIVAGLAMLAHHFALFSFLGQIGFVTALVFVERHRHRDYTPLLRGLCLALAAAFAVYSWWLPVFICQAREVHADFWIPPINGEWVLHVLAYVMLSTTGMPAAIVGIALFVAVIFVRAGFNRMQRREEVQWGALNRQSVDLYLLIQFVLPFACCIGISFLTGRSILQERYLVMCQVSWICLLARAIGEGKPVRLKMFGLVALCSTAIIGIFHDISLRSQRTRGGVESLAFIKEHWLPSDKVITGNGWDLNVCRYYLSRASCAQGEVLLIQGSAPITTNFGHQGHLSVLDREEIFVPDGLELRSHRVWVWSGAEATQCPSLPPAYVKIGTHRFGKDGLTAFNVDEYEVQQPPQ
jgi:hypothetical protein